MEALHPVAEDLVPRLGVQEEMEMRSAVRLVKARHGAAQNLPEVLEVCIRGV
jgi:hypothetical protein